MNLQITLKVMEVRGQQVSGNTCRSTLNLSWTLKAAWGEICVCLPLVRTVPDTPPANRWNISNSSLQTQPSCPGVTPGLLLQGPSQGRWEVGSLGTLPIPEWESPPRGMTSFPKAGRVSAGKAAPHPPPQPGLPVLRYVNCSLQPHF